MTGHPESDGYIPLVHKALCIILLYKALPEPEPLTGNLNTTLRMGQPIVVATNSLRFVIDSVNNQGLF